MRKAMEEAIASGLNEYERKLDRRLVEELVESAIRVEEGRDQEALDPEPPSPGSSDAAPLLPPPVLRRLFESIRRLVDDELESVFSLRKRFADYAKAYSRASGMEEKERRILDFARDLGATRLELREDRKAFSRWFGHDAISERCSRKIFLTERKMSFHLERLGAIARQVLESQPPGSDLRETWSALDLESTLKAFFAYDGDSRVSISAFRSLSRALRALPAKIQERSVDERTLQFIYRSAMHPRLEVWLQCEALSLLETLSPESLLKVLAQRLGKPGGGDDVFVRKHAVKILGAHLAEHPALVELLPVVAADPSPFVRQGLGAALEKAPAGITAEWLRALALRDESPQVRAAALLVALRALVRRELEETVLAMVVESLGAETDSFVLRVGAHVAAEGAVDLAERGSPFLASWRDGVVPALEKLHTGAALLPVRRWAAGARERIWCECDAAARAIKAGLESRLAGLLPGKSRVLPAGSLGDDEERAGRVLSVLGQTDYGFDVEVTPKGPRITRGHVFGFRGWRFLHELRNPSPDKRQAFQHTIGRKFPGGLRAPSTILSELAETRVPGEPLFLAEEGGWRPYVPLLDEALSTLTRRTSAGPVKIFTSEGVTELAPPRGLRRRLRAFLSITSGFAGIAKLRNWRSQLQESPSTYLRALSDLGYEVRFRPHERGEERTSVDSAVTRFFPAVLPWPGTDELWSRFRDYFVSVYDNTIFELGLFTLAACSLFVGRHIYAGATVKAWRKRIPLVVGGWGTRGKSGTERLKAALFNALGYGVVSKTTGCEAMFLYAHAFAKTREMFLFRSYDKATIWEQRNVIRLAERLGADVFLWECMALTPSYVEVLQHHWVRDDLSTITNTYPDHEDLQGPAGIDIPDVIAIFMPGKSKAVTTEEQMLPILVEKAKKLKTSLRSVSWIEPGLIAPDMLKRFPYDEHPANIALVLALSEELGIDRDFAIKEMADRVVPDLGVLKTSPIARVRDRRLQFSNGCSANERHGTLSNWIRCGFNVQDPIAEPGVWITTVVNNRADRVPRSRVFARILVEDIYADRHFLIGGNLNGLVGYIRQSWDAYAPTISLWPKDSADKPAAVLREMARRFRQPMERAHVSARLMAMLSGKDLPPGLAHELEESLDAPEAIRQKLSAAGLTENLDAIISHHEQSLEHFKDFEKFHLRVEQASEAGREPLDAEFRELLWKWFQRKLVVVEDYYISGEQLVNQIAETTPPGYLNRVMGIQNIKGTGLDFVYRWQAWDTCYKACDLLASNDPSTAEKGLRALAAFHEFGVLSAEHVQETLERVKKSAVAQSEHFQAELALIQSSYELEMDRLKEKLGAVRKESSRFEKWIAALEGFVDAGDAVRRRKTANRIYKDLIADRISAERAALELQNLNKRQKGGWLLEHVLRTKSRLWRAIRMIIGRTGK